MTIPLQSIALSDRYTLRTGQILISGVQALVRLMLLQADRDAAAGFKTGGFVSGYRGSPLGTLDTAFAGVRDLIDARGIVVRPAVNEELGATAVAGTQQIAQTPNPKVEGVFALWYGKGPGLDRASDAIRHGVFQGASPQGGVVLAVGDDHVAKSSSIICYSDDVVAGLMVPLFYPADAREIVEYGLHGFALSRHTGAVAAIKILTEVADATRTAFTDELAVAPVLPPIAPPPMGLHNRWPESPQDQEVRHVEHRLPAVLDYVRANRLDQALHKTADSRIGLVAAGKTWLDVREALRLLGLDDAALAAHGVALYKPALIWPLEPHGLIAFSEGLQTLVVIEEKGPFVERQAKELLYGRAGAPAIWGKHGAAGRLLPATGDLTPERIAVALAPLIGGAEAVAERLRTQIDSQIPFAAPPQVRKPFFCSGCPHNRSTVVPEGSRATAGIGCHGLAAYNRPRTASFTQMGGEGVPWVGLAPFTDEAHVFANMGDGTYFHSGLLAIRQALAAGVNITYKLLYNSAVAMTGGQSVDGELSVAQIIDQLRAEGVKTIIVSTDEPDRYPTGDPVRAKSDGVEHRDDLEALQLRLRDTPGVSVIVYEQMCATEKRRLRKRGRMPDPTRRVFINELVCEGCGDCSVKSNCLSVEPIETAFGTKRRINQSSCNKDESCLNGYCPSLVTIEGAKPRRATGAAGTFDATTLPEPVMPAAHGRILVGGIGGTGVVTIGALAAMAAHMAGRAAGVLDQVGMAQKGGAVISHLHLAGPVAEPITALRIPTESADLVMVGDQVVGNMPMAMAAIAPGRTNVLVNTDVAITGDFTTNRDAAPDATLLARRLRKRAGEDRVFAYPFTRLAEALFGDAIGSNLMMLGFAWQRGWIGLERDAIHAAIALNGTATAMNLAAFAWGRRLAVDPDAVLAAAGLADPAPETLDALVDRRATFLEAYQDRAYADRYRHTVRRVAEAEARVGGRSAELARTAAQALFRLMAYKDEYEVARLYTDGSFAAALDQAFDDHGRISFHMAPPVFARRDPVTGHLRKRRFGPWIMPLLRLLAGGRRLRGSAFDPLGRTAERRAERRMIADYERLLADVCNRLTMDNLATAVTVLGLALEVRGYGHVKERAMAEYPSRLDAALRDLERVGGSTPAHDASRAAVVAG